MNAGDILDHAIRIYRRNFVPLVTIVAIVSLPFAAMQVAIALLTNPFGFGFPNNSQQFNPDSFATSTFLAGQLLGYVVMILSALAIIFQSAALAVYVSERFLGRPITVRQAYGRAFSRWLSLLIAVILLALVNIAIFGSLFGVWLVPFIGFAATSSGMGGAESAIFGAITLLLCCLLVPAIAIGVFLNTRWAFFIQAIVLENYNSTGGMGRSWKLVKGSFWRVFLMLLVLAIIVYAFSMGPILLVTMGAALLASPIFIVVMTTLSQTLITLIITPLQFAALTVLYYDLRIRKEGFDLELQMQELPPAPPPVNTLTTPAPPQSNPAPPLDLPPLYSRDDY